MNAPNSPPPPSAPAAPEPTANVRDRILAAAYRLFSQQGIRAVGIDAIIQHSGVAKMTLYRHFPSKEDLVLAFLSQRETRWTTGWLRAEVEQRAESPRERLLAIFDVMGEWFEVPGFEGCSFINVMLETTDRNSPVRKASVECLARIREYLQEVAAAAGIADPGAFASKWHILMKGAVVAAAEGDSRAAAHAREIGALLLASEPPIDVH